MHTFLPASLAGLTIPETATPVAPRTLSIWEITSWILPMAPEHFRRVLAAEPHLPQGSAGGEGGTRWFTQADLARLRAHFATGSRKARYQPSRPLRAPLVALTAPLGPMGRTTALLHLAVGAALSGYRILVIEGDAAGTLDRTLPVSPGHGGVARLTEVRQGALSLIAQSAAGHLRRMNEARLDRGEAPQPMDDRLTAALALTAADLIRPTLWPGLDVMPLAVSALLGDVLIAGWRHALRGWQPSRGFAAGLEDLRPRYDLILVDTPRGLGPMALSLLGAADILLAPLPLPAAKGQGSALPHLTAGLQALAEAQALTETEAQSFARALGQTPAPPPPQQLLILPTNAGPDTARQMAGFAAKLGEVLLPEPLPEVEAVALGQVAHLYDLDYRSIGRLAYAPLRQACDTACLAAIKTLTSFAAEP